MPTRLPHPVDFDARDFAARRTATGTKREVRVGGSRVQLVGVHEFTGTPISFRPTTPEPHSDASPVARALAYVRAVTEEIARPGEVLEWVPDRRRSTTSAGRRVVHLHQQYRGIPVFEATRTAIFADSRRGDGALYEVSGDHVPLADGLAIHPEIDAPTALLAACRHLAPAVEATGRPLTDHPPAILSTPRLAALPTMLHKRPFEDPVSAHLVMFDLDGLDSPDARLGWFLSLSLPSCDGAWELIVEAAGPDAGRLLWARDVRSHARRGRGDVWLDSPDEGSRRRLDFPHPLAELPPVRPRDPLPDGFPPLWIATCGTSGNNVLCRPVSGALLKGEIVRGVCTFAPADDAEGLDQKVLNAFYWVNRMHDLFYLLGFDEARGNFQERNFTGAPRAGDRVEVRIERAVPGGASFILAHDGRKPRMSLGDTKAGRPTALSADVVIHECVHGLTNRLVGGTRDAHPMHQSPHSRAVDEGICDWFALTVQNHARLGEEPPRPAKTVFGAWVADDPEKGLRDHSYAHYPRRFGDPATDPDLVGNHHAAGQVFGAALLEMNRRFGDVLGDDRHGHELGWQVVVDALKETARTPGSITFLHTRDRIEEALAALGAASPERADGTALLPDAAVEACEEGVREAFAEYGMGPGASGGAPRFEDAVGG